ncbi:MAG: anthrone oxygenase family protein [Pseudomonadota bacterium]
MTPILTVSVYAIAALILALISGVFLAFSDFVMRSLRAASPTSGIEAMQQINRKVYSSVFLTWLLGMAPVATLLSIYAFVFVEGPASTWWVAGGAFYVIGTFLVTVLGNVPMNKRLDPMTPNGTVAHNYWGTYATIWTRWNHVRTVASAIAAACFFVGCLLYV